MSEKYPPGTKVWVRCFNYTRTLGRQRPKLSVRLGEESTFSVVGILVCSVG